MSLIFETSKFTVVAHDNPHHDRNNGGHAKVMSKVPYVDRTQMPLALYDGIMKLVLVTGEAITNVMKNKGIDVVRINYQDNGNWPYFPSIKAEPHMHVHLYTRSKNEKHPTGDKRFQAFPNALYFPFVGDFPEYYESFKPYTHEDCRDIENEINRLLDSKKYAGVKELL